MNSWVAREVKMEDEIQLKFSDKNEENRIGTR